MAETMAQVCPAHPDGWGTCESGGTGCVRQALTPDAALAYATRAAYSALRHWRNGTADASDVAAESVCRILERADRLALTRQTIAATVRRVAIETMAGRTRAEREASLPVSLDRPADGTDGTGSLAETLADSGTADGQTDWQRESDSLPVRLADGSLAWLDGQADWHCAADAQALTVRTADGQVLTGRQAVMHCQAVMAGTGSTARGSMARAQTARAQTADRDAAVLAVADSGVPWQTALDTLAAQGISLSRVAYRQAVYSARKRASGQSVRQGRQARA